MIHLQYAVRIVRIVDISKGLSLLIEQIDKCSIVWKILMNGAYSHGMYLNINP